MLISSYTVAIYTRWICMERVHGCFLASPTQSVSLEAAGCGFLLLLLLLLLQGVNVRSHHPVEASHLLLSQLDTSQPRLLFLLKCAETDYTLQLKARDVELKVVCSLAS